MFSSERSRVDEETSYEDIADAFRIQDSNVAIVAKAQQLPAPYCLLIEVTKPLSLES